MLIEIDGKSGFCFGVVNAITLAEEALHGGGLCTTGDVVHNPREVERLAGLGLRRVEAGELKRGERLLVRAHGEPPSTYERAGREGIEIVDATCPVVARLQRLVAEAAERMVCENGQVVILGRRGHAEVVGLAGNARGREVIVESESDLSAVDFGRPIVLISQTTQSVALFEQLAEEIRRRALSSVEMHDTICRQVASREEHLADFARRFDVVLFVSGRGSSNGQVLFEVVRQANGRAHLIEDETEIEPQWFAGVGSVGICGATSTPQWLMENVKCKIENVK